MIKKIVKQRLVMLLILISMCIFASTTIKAEAASKSVNKVYCCLYKSGKLVISQKKIKPEKGKKVLENKKLSRPSLLKNKAKVKTIEIKGRIRPKNCKNYFVDFGRLKSIKNLKKLDTSATTNMYGMFSGCWQLTKLDVGRKMYR